MPAGSTVIRRQLGRRLRQLREAAGKTAGDVEAAGLGSVAKLWRIETGKVAVKVADTGALSWLYGADPETVRLLRDMAVGTNAQGWWEDYGNVLPDWFGLYLGLEAEADDIRVYDPELVHGLFQTGDYARAVYQAGRHAHDEKLTHRAIELRLERQRVVLGRNPPPRVTAVLGAGVLARYVGGVATMQEQTARLRELDTQENITVRVLSWETGAHAAMLGAFTIMKFNNPDDPAVVYLESHAGAQYVERADQLKEFLRIFELIFQRSVPLGEYKP